jgi:Zn-dependent oligopeptidase
MKSIATSQVNEVLVFSKNEELVAKLLAIKNAGQKNAPVLGQIIEKRDQSAHLKGFQSYSGEATESLMVKNPATVERFLERVIQKI